MGSFWASLSVIYRRRGRRARLSRRPLLTGAVCPQPQLGELARLLTRLRSSSQVFPGRLSWLVRRAAVQSTVKPRHPRKFPFEACLGVSTPLLTYFAGACGISTFNCGSTLVGNPEGPVGCVEAVTYCSAAAGIVFVCYAASRGYPLPAPPKDLGP